MKRLAPLWLLGVVLLSVVLLGGIAGAGEARWRVRVDLQIVAVPVRDALRLIPRLQDPDQFEGALAETQGMIDRDEAELIAWPVAFASPEGPNGTSRFESLCTLDVHYPAEYDPPQVPFGITRPEIPPTMQSAPELFGGAMDPTAFETRPCGVTLVCTVALSNGGKLVTLELESQETRLRAIHDEPGSGDMRGINGICQSAEFVADHLISKIQLPNGGRVLAGSTRSPNASPEILLVLLHATAIPADRGTE